MFKLINRLVAIFAFVGVTQFAYADGDHMAVFTRQGSFDDAREAVEQALTGRGFVINSVSHIGDMLERTGKDLGGVKQIYLKAEALEFCSATVSRRMMEADPDNIVFCPYIIYIYVVPNKPKEVRLAYRKTQMVGTQKSKDALKAVNELLTEIIQEAVQ